MSVSSIADTLQNAFGQRQIATLFTQANQYRVVLEVDQRQATGLSALQNLYVPTSSGEPAPLSSVATVKERQAPLLINHQGQFPSATVSFNLTPGISLGKAVTAIETVQQEIALPLQWGER